MASETWWHGQKHAVARMGEASEAARWVHTSHLVATFDGAAELSSQKKFRRQSNALPTFRKGLRNPQGTSSALKIVQILLLAICLFVKPSTAAFVNFVNCLSPDIINSTPPQLQFVPLYVWATFNSSAVSHSINVTTYGNVAGIATQQNYPPPSDPQWKNPNDTIGKIPDVAGPSAQPKYTTFTTTFNVLDYTPYNPPAVRFCNSSSLTQCPLTPVFNFTGNEMDATQLPAFTVAHDLYSSYAFTSINVVLRLKSGDQNAAPLACVQASVTPYLGKQLSNTLTYLPLVVLILVAIATACAAIFSPWGSADVFKFTSNYGRDDDLLRLVTPGFGDCLQYLQFIVLAGSLSLNYPGFFQPVVSRISWSALMFNESFVSHVNGSHSLVDGMYVTNGSYGLDRMSQLVGMTADKDIWAGMMIWLIVIVIAIIVLIQLGFAARWAYRFISNTQQEDLRQKDLPFSAGNAIRIVFNYFLLPVVSLSTYQLVIAGRSAGGTVGGAAVVLVILICFAGFVLWLIATTRPRSYLFDDLPTVLLYGPLYNTFSDNAATFALVPVMLTFIRGIAIGAVQPSGIAQLVLLAICEVIKILTLNAFRPFHSPTSMNAFHTFFAVIRLLVILLSTAFLPSLGVKDAPRGWIGYIILLMHAIVLVFGFFLNACQTLIEVLARLAGAGGEESVGGGAARGGLVKVFGMRQLSRRNPRRGGRARQSVGSDAAILTQESDQKSLQWNGGRSRSISGSSAILLNRQGAGDNRRSVGLDSAGSAGGAGDTPISGGASAFSYLPGGSQAAGQGGSGGGIVNLRSAESADPYYRPPRPRRTTLEADSPSGRTQGSWGTADWANKRWSHHSPDLEGSPKPNAEAAPASGRGTPLPAHLGGTRDRSDSDAEDPRQSKTDYATREVDYYYGVRGPALSNQPTRRLKTGPADPTGPVSSASGWIKSLFGGKTKDKGKGFEVVRSSRAPAMGRRTPSGAILTDEEARYSDEPGVTQPERSRDLALSDEGDAIGAGTRHLPDDESSSPLTSDGEGDGEGFVSDEDWRPNRESQISQFPPTLPTIETPGGIELPSRIASKASSRPTRESTRRSTRPPNIPRKSSRRDSSSDIDKGPARLSTVMASPPTTPQRPNRPNDPYWQPQQTLQPPEDTARRLPFGSQHNSSRSQDTHMSAGGTSINSSMFSPGTQEDNEDGSGHARHSSSVLGSLAPHDLQLDRPSSMGYVQQHRASDNIHTASPDDPQILGSSAELVNDADRRCVSPEVPQPHAL